LGLAVGLWSAAPPVEASTPDPNLVAGNNTFAFDLYNQLTVQQGNLFFSPYSISTALAMTYAGARERTETQMARTLHFALSQKRLHPAFGTLGQGLNAIQKEGKVKLHVANSLFPQEDYKFLSEYTGLIKKHYSASATPVDYRTGTEEARQTINSWVEKKTENKIKNLIKRGMLNSTTRMVLANAIYFKGDWARQFKREVTADAPFHLTASKSVNVPMMRQMADFKYGKSDGIQILEMPYDGRQISMLVLLPEQGKLGDLERILSTEKIKKWVADLIMIELRVLIPRFKMTREFNLTRTLYAMGMTDAFDEARADFSGMDGTKGSLFISDVVHKAYVDVNEEGTEAAAATGVRFKVTAVAPVQEFHANRPFIFLIKENDTGSILFMGRVTDPTKEGS
jgi:serpin B